MQCRSSHFRQVIQITNQSWRFYSVMGQFLSQREITKELGSPVWDDLGKLWWLSATNFYSPLKPTIHGFVAAIRLPNKKVSFCSDYVIPEFRGQGVYRELFAARLEAFPAATIKATVTKSSKKEYENNGFKCIGVRGGFWSMCRSSFL